MGLFCECLIIPAWYTFHSVSVCALLHLFFVCLSGAALHSFLKKKKGTGEPRAFYLYIFAIAAFFPAAGFVMAAVIAIGLKKFGATAKKEVYEEYEEYIESEKTSYRERESFSVILRKIRGEVSFKPFIDIIKGENVEEKEKAVQKLATMNSRMSVHLLKEALRDASAQVRFYAAGALLKTEEEINSKIHAALERLERRGGAADYSSLGDLYRTYAEIGLIEKSLGRHYLELSCQAYQESLDIDTDQPAAIISYAENLIALARYDKAKSLLDKAVRLWPHDTQMLFLRSRVYFQLGLIKEVPACLYGIKRTGLDARRKEVFDLWTETSQGAKI